jgi:hypothetical protein
MLRALCLHVGASHFRGHRVKYGILLRLEGLIIGAQHLGRAAHATEKIQLPEGVEPGIVERLRAVESTTRRAAEKGPVAIPPPVADSLIFSRLICYR